MLQGPFSLDYVDYHVKYISSGVYIFCNGNNRATYVGRSDLDVGDRIKKSKNEGNYSHFLFEYASSPRDAYLKECEYYHKYNPPDNSYHPAVPAGTIWRCPVSGCEWS